MFKQTKESKESEKSIKIHPKPPYVFDRTGEPLIVANEPVTRSNHSFLQQWAKRSTNDSSLIQPWVQTKLKIGKPGDKYEQEADRIAGEVSQELMRKTTVNAIGQHAPTYRLSGTSARVGMNLSPNLESKVQQIRQSGNILPAQLRKPLEQTFGADFGKVRIHTDTQAEKLNRSLRTRAFTAGHDIFFSHGAFDPNKNDVALLAHELTHVIQQDRGSSSNFIQAVGEPAITPVQSQTITDAITLFQNSNTFASHQPRSNQILHILNSFHPGEIGYQSMQYAGRAHSIPGDEPGRYEIELSSSFAGNVARTALTLVHEAIHHILWGINSTIWQEIECRNFQLDFYQELVNNGLAPIQNYQVQIVARNNNQLIDLILRPQWRYKWKLHGWWVRENYWRWDGLPHRLGHTKARYIQVLLEDTSDRRWNTRLVLSILETIANPSDMDWLMNWIGGGNVQNGYIRLRTGLRDLGMLTYYPENSSRINELNNQFPNLHIAP